MNIDDQRDALLQLGVYPARPSAEITSLLNALQPLGVECTYSDNELIPLTVDKQKVIYLLIKGRSSVSRPRDGLTIATVNSPLVIGLADYLQPLGSIDWKAQGECRCIKIPAIAAFKRIEELGLWPMVATFISWQLKFFIMRDNHLVGVSAYAMLRVKLLELTLIPEDLRQDINVTDYIQQRTQLARSTIMTILGELRKGEYIEIKRGRLVNIRHLPNDY